MKRNILKTLSAAAMMLGVATTSAMAQATGGIGQMADTVRGNLGPVLALIMIAAFVGGVFFVISGILKLKNAKEDPRENNPTTITQSFVAGLLLIFLGGAILAFQSTIGLGNTNLGGDQSVTYGG